MNSKNSAGIVIGAIVLCGISLYGGMQYGKKSAAPSFGAGGANGQRQFGGVPGQGRGGFVGGGFVGGTIASKDEKSMTIQLSAGGSKIVFFASSTTIGKMTSGSAGDLSVGTNVVVNGTPNADGSVTAATVQIRPAGEPMPGKRPAGQ